MGNCMCMSHQKTSSSLSGDDRGAFLPRHRKRIKTTSPYCDEDGGEREDLLGESRMMTSSFSGGFSSSSADVRSEKIKIRITKKDLEDLMSRINLKGLTGEEVLASLIMDGGDQLGYSDPSLHQRSWRPTLQSIPEVD